MDLYLIKNPPKDVIDKIAYFTAPIESSKDNEYYLVAMDEKVLDGIHNFYTIDELEKLNVKYNKAELLIKASGEIFGISSKDTKMPIMANFFYGDESSIKAKMKMIQNSLQLELTECVFVIVNDFEVIIFNNNSVSAVRQNLKKDYLLLKYTGTGKFVEV